jgi:uroporphyrin-3 C-methyltransferase
MTDNSKPSDAKDVAETPKVEKAEAEQSKPAAAKATAEPKAAKSGGAKTGLLWFVVLITLAVCAGGAYFVWQLMQKQENDVLSQEKLLGQTQTAIVDLKDDMRSGLDALKADDAKAQSGIEKSGQRITLLEKSLEKQERHLRELSYSNRDDWLLAETEYLLRLANQRLLMSKDAAGALAMLEASDKILREIDDVALHNVRKALAADISKLRAAPKVDIDGTYLRLTAVADQVSGLKLHEIPDFDTPEVEFSAVENDADWQAKLGQVWGSVQEGLQKVFVVRQEGESVEAMLPPQDELYLRQNLRLMLEQAQLALLSQRSSIYENSLEKAQRWILQYFNSDSDQTQGALNTIAELKAVEVDPALPDIAASYRSLKDYMNRGKSPVMVRKPQAAPAEAVQEKPVAPAKEQKAEEAKASAEVKPAQEKAEEKQEAETKPAPEAAAEEAATQEA